jgi:hypothetical protein
MGKDFVKQITELNANDIPSSVKKAVLDKFIHSPEWNIEAITNTSKAAGALASWA